MRGGGIRRLVVFGATGDLTSRYLLPALIRLDQAGRLPDELAVVGIGRHEWSTADFRRHMIERLERHAVRTSSRSCAAFASRLEYCAADVTEPDQVRRALAGVAAEPLVAYLALPPVVYAPTVEALAACHLPEGSRVVIEKPFGHDLASAQALNRLLRRSFPERAVFRIDHFFGKQTVQNVLGLRFANRVFEPLWNREHVGRVEIVWDETLGLEGRAGYYDAAGALRDMVQNHLLQLLCLIAMEPPLSLGERDLRDRKVDVLRAVRRFSPEEVERWTVRARYGRPAAGDGPAYVEEPGVDPARETETFARVTLFVDNWRWAGVPFLLRTGKALRRDRREIAVGFRPVPHPAFGQGSRPRANALRLRLDPDHVTLAVNVNGPGDPFDLEEVELDLTLAPQDLPAYGRLLLDVLEGDPTFFVRADEAEESWRIVEPILEAWAAGRVPLGDYPAGSEGPPARRARA